METKKCLNCNKRKTVNNFTKDKSKKDGLKIHCRDCCKLYYKKYHLDNKEKENLRVLNYMNNNPDIVMKCRKNFYKNNKDKVLLNNKISREKYKEERKENRRNNILLRLKENIGNGIRSTMKERNLTKKSKTTEILGCSKIDFKLYIESKFETWMTWENYGKYNGEFNYGWDIDHIIPISSAKTEEDIIRLNHYTNLQPLCSYTNRYIKRNKEMV